MRPELPPTERVTQIVDERLLTEVDHLSQHRQSDGSYPTQILDDLLLNNTTAVQEAAMPCAVATIEHPYVYDERIGKGTCMWLGKTAVENAMSGYKFHVTEPAFLRTDVEVDEAHTDPKEGVMKLFISPRMSEKDAAKEIAEQENLAHDDSIRVSWPVLNLQGEIEKRVMQSLLVRDIPLQAWVDMLADPANMFGRAIVVDDPESALAVMKVHRELEVPLGTLPDGPVGIIRAVLPYIKDPECVGSVSEQLEQYYVDQEDLRVKAENVAQRWLQFEVALSESLDDGFANFDIRRFIIGLQHQWGEEDSAVLRDHMLPNTEYRMTRELAVVLERAKRNLLWAPAAVIAGNQEVLKQLTPQMAEQIYTNEMLAQIAWANGQSMQTLEAQSNRLVASQNLRVGGGCPGEVQANFNTDKEKPEPGHEFDTAENSEENKENWKWKQGVCQVRTCPTRPGKTEVGPCDVCRICQAKFDKGEDPTIEQPGEASQLVPEKSGLIATRKALLAETYEDKELANEFDQLVKQHDEQLVTI